MCISWTVKGLISLMHGITTKSYRCSLEMGRITFFYNIIKHLRRFIYDQRAEQKGQKIKTVYVTVGVGMTSVLKILTI